MTYIPKAGDTVYSTDGAMALYVGPAQGGGHIVQPLFEDGDGVTEPDERWAEGADVWAHVHHEAPKPMLDKAILEQQQKLLALKREVSEREQQKRRAELEHRDVRERLAQHEALQYLDQFLNAEITHYVHTVEGRIVVQDGKAFNSAKSGAHSYHERVLTLWATVRDAGKALQWKLKIDSVASDRDIWCFPSAEQAQAKAVELITTKMRGELATLKRGGTVYGIDSVLKNAAALGVAPLPELLEILRAQEIAAAQKAAAEAQARAEQARQKLAALGVAG